MTTRLLKGAVDQRGGQRCDGKWPIWPALCVGNLDGLSGRLLLRHVAGQP
jgi:hypothetical protein